MNAANSLSSSVLPDDNGSDSDTNTDEASDYYQPISADGDDETDGEQQEDDSSTVQSNHHQANRVAEDSRNLENGHCFEEAEGWISSLHLNGVKSDEESGTDVEEETVVSDSSNSVVRAFREDENRRNAPLTAENSTRVMEAMRGISFVGSAPEWAVRVPETQWIDQIRRLRQLPQNSAAGN
ncbi:hypothetical protein LINPERHAP2_LOCUS34631 [Linum perenne]